MVICKKWCHPSDYDYLHIVTRSLKSNEHEFYRRVLFERDIYPAVIIVSINPRDGEYTRKVVNLIDRFSASVPVVWILSPKRVRECFYSLAAWNIRAKIKHTTPSARQLEYVCEFHPVYNNEYLASSTTMATEIMGDTDIFLISKRLTYGQTNECVALIPQTSFFFSLSLFICHIASNPILSLKTNRCATQRDKLFPLRH